MEAPQQHHTWINPTKARYYQVHLAQDLFGDWTLRKVWGGIGSRRGGMRHSGLVSYEEGIKQLREIATRRDRRGYRAVASL